jgi:hypothetical protein
MKYVRFSLQFFFLLGGMIAKSEPLKGIPKSEEDFATKEVRESLHRYVETLAEIESMPPNEAIPKLNEMILRTFRWRNEESMAVYRSAQQKLLSIPDHTKYFTDKIEESWKSHAEGVRKIEFPPDWNTQLEELLRKAESPEGYFNWLRGQWGDYEEICSKNLGMLGHIPSTQSVRALGHYLRERDKPDIKIEWPKTGNTAAESLTGLISDGPTRIWMASWEDVPKWQQWFDEVKAGKRTFRFVGSDVEYTLDGPADARTLERIRNKDGGIQRSAAKREQATMSGAQAATNSKGPAFYAGLIAAALLCLSALAFLYKHGNQQR